MDVVIGKIVRVLRQNDLLDTTYIVFVADHGEELLEHGWIGHASTAIEAKLVPEILHIPLIISGPGLPRGVTTSTLVQQVDLLPTLCHLLGVAAPPSLDGAAVRFTGRSALGSRSLAYFDSSAGGNLTPPERRTERLQGVTDGRCLHAVHRTREGASPSVAPVGAATCTPADERALAGALRDWQKQQADRRLEVLADAGERRAPDPADAAGYDEVISILEPAPDTALGWREAAGQIVLAWEGAAGDAWIEYRVGSAPGTVDGVFHADAEPMVFGPFPEAFWNDLARHNPYRFRILVPARNARSAWRTFTLESSR
jgi:hypothetical protein